MSGTMDFPLESRFKSKEDYIKALNAFYRGDKPVTSIDNSSKASDLDLLNNSNKSNLSNNINQDSTKLSSSDGNFIVSIDIFILNIKHLLLNPSYL